jgi:cell division protein FtsZ
MKKDKAKKIKKTVRLAKGKILSRPFSVNLSNSAKKTVQAAKSTVASIIKEQPPVPAEEKTINEAMREVSEPEFEIRKTKIKIIGIGGGGCNIVSEISGRVKKATFTAANTDSAALKAISDKVTIFQFGEKFTHGLGTGMDAQVGEDAAREEKEKIKKMIEGHDLIVLVSSLGGGAGSGAASVFAQVSKSLGILTFGIFTLPFAFEGAKKKEIATAALERVRPYLNALTILPNERVFAIVPKTTPFSKTLSFINKTLSDGLEGLIETIYEPGLINIDFADLRTILSGQGKLAFLNSVDFKKSETPGLESIEEVLNSPLFPYNVEKAKGILLNIIGERDLKLSEVNQILNGIQQKIHKDAKIIFGVSQPSGSDKTFKVTILATGCVSKEDEGSGAFGPPAEKKEPGRAAARKINEARSERQNQKKTKDGAKPKKAAIKTAEKKAALAKPAAKQKKAKDADKPPGQPPKPANTRIRVREGEPAAGKPKPEPDELKDLFKLVAPVADKLPETEGLAVRKNAMQVKKDMEQEEKEILEKEKMWDIPAFLRKRPKDV